MQQWKDNSVLEGIFSPARSIVVVMAVDWSEFMFTIQRVKTADVTLTYRLYIHRRFLMMMLIHSSCTLFLLKITDVVLPCNQHE